jgi:hypothetical protein
MFCISFLVVFFRDKTLISIGLGGNQIGVKGIEYLSNVLRSNTVIFNYSYNIHGVS